VVKSGRGCTRSFGERNKWHLRGSIYRLIWISRTSDAFLPLFSLLSRLFLRGFSSFSHSPSSSFSCSSPCYARVVLRFPMMMMVVPTSLHGTLNVSWKLLLCCRFYLLLRVNSFERLDSSLLRYSLSLAIAVSCWASLPGDVKHSVWEAYSIIIKVCKFNIWMTCPISVHFRVQFHQRIIYPISNYLFVFFRSRKANYIDLIYK